MKVFWIIYELVLLGGAVAWGLLILKYGNQFKFYKEHFEELVIKQTEKSKDQKVAYNYVYFKKSNALVRLAAHSVIEFVYIYIIVDLLFTHIIGG